MGEFREGRSELNTLVCIEVILSSISKITREITKRSCVRTVMMESPLGVQVKLKDSNLGKQSEIAPMYSSTLKPCTGSV